MSKVSEMMAKEAGCDKKPKKDDNRIYYSANFEGLCDLVMQDKQIKFLMSGGELEESVELDGKIYFPPNQGDLDYIVPEVDNVLSEAKKHDNMDDKDCERGCGYCLSLFKELLTYHKMISELPNKLYYYLLSLFDFHTYLIDKFNFSPIIYFFADKERGKTRTAKGMIYIVRRGVMTETLREANLIRWSRDVRATLLFDVKNFARKLEQSQAEDLVYGRAERGVVASRVLFPEKGAFRDTVRFEVFGPTIVTSNKMVDDVGLSRMITIDMKPSERIFKFEPTKEAGILLKEKLTGMRLAHINQPFVSCEKEETGRIEDMLIGYKSLILTLFPSLLGKYYELKKLAKEQKIENALDSFEAQILQIVLQGANAVEEGSLVLTYDYMCSIYNEGKPDKLHLEPRSLSRTLKAMGFTSKRNADRTKRGIFYDLALIGRLKKIYGLEDLEDVEVDPLPASESSVSSSQEKTTEAIFST